MSRKFVEADVKSKFDMKGGADFGKYKAKLWLWKKKCSGKAVSFRDSFLYFSLLQILRK